MKKIAPALLIATLVFTTGASVRADVHEQTQNVVYAERHGVALVMDIFTPTGEKNGLAIVDVISGAWNADRGKIRDHERAQVFRIMCQHGYTVFAIRPGSLSRFSLFYLPVVAQRGSRKPFDEVVQLVWTHYQIMDSG